MAQSSLSRAERPSSNSRHNSKRFDVSSVAFKQNPLPTFAAMRAAGHIVPIRMPVIGKVWATTSHAATLAMVKDQTLFVQEGRHAGKSGGAAGMQWWMPKSLRRLGENMLQKDEPDHRRLRKLVDSAFARRDILAMRGRIEQLADRLLDRLDAGREVDLLETYARRLPLEVICELLGLPESDRAEFSDWTRRTLTLSSALDVVRLMPAISRMTDYLRGQIEACRHTARPGLIGELVRAEADGDKLNEDELIAMVFLLLLAGFETTTNLIADSVVALDQHPDQKAYLLADPANRMERAVEELARYMSPVQSTKPRYVARDTEFFGQPLRRGDMIMAWVAAANADPEQFEAPEALRLDRFPNAHLVFSSGIHFCLGMQLARVETQAALSRLYARFPDLTIPAADDLQWTRRVGIRGVAALPTQLTGVSSIRQAA